MLYKYRKECLGIRRRWKSSGEHLLIVGSDITPPSSVGGELRVVVFILEHPAIALKQGAGFHGE